MNRTKNYLLGYKDLYIYQTDGMFKFSLDSVLLPNFVTINKRISNILDIGTGNGPIPLILSTKTKAKIVGVEIQKEVAKLAEDSVLENKLNDQIKIINDDINYYYKYEESEKYDIITCNPPFFNSKQIKNESEYKTLARHEKTLTLERMVLISRKLLKNKGIMAIVHRPERMVEIFLLMRENNIEPKRIRFVYPTINKEANVILIEGMKNGHPGLKIMPPLYVYGKDMKYTEEIESYLKG